MSKARLVALCLTIAMGAIAQAAPLRVLAVGDSLTEEYVFEVPFSAPDSSALVANTRNWVEILAQHRSAHFTMGSYSSSIASYPDLRNGGYKFNYGIPSFTTGNWLDVIHADWWDLFRYATRTALIRHIQDGEVDVVVIFLGGNDLKSNYTGIFLDEQPPALLARTVENLEEIHDFIRGRANAAGHQSLPIVIATVPDIGASPDVAGKYTDPDLRIRARQRIAAMNAEIIAMATGKGATVARIDSVSDRIFDEHPFLINGTSLVYEPHPENPPDHLFCKDGFHPSTSGQAFMANALIDALNQATGSAIPTLMPREILGNILGLNPDQPYLDWAGNAGDMTENPDGDGLPNLVEFVLGTQPLQADSPFTFSTDGTLAFTPTPAGLAFASLDVWESGTLTQDWETVPHHLITITPGGTWQIAPNGSSRNFYRLEVRVRP